MRLTMKETCKKVDLEGTAATWAFVRYKHDPADFPLLGGAPAEAAPPPKAEPKAEPPPAAAPPAAAAPDPLDSILGGMDDEPPSKPPPKPKEKPKSKPEPEEDINFDDDEPLPPPPKKTPAKAAPKSKSSGTGETSTKSVEEIEDWLDSVGLDSLKRHFRDANVTGKALLQLKSVSQALSVEAFIGFLKEELGVKRTGDILHLMYALEHELK
eukprot:c20174_g1_i2.p2 GENE.c20174_g1_i2~~c20174_g1_i2.p2  ORF type:complete len:212 (-),score=29.54 c20174_g1_i2:70-705(-)